MDSTLLEAGAILDERYRIVRVLGQGGMGTVYEAEHLSLESRVALKVLHPALSGKPNLEERFRREAKLVAKLNDPRVVRVNDFGIAPGGGLFMVMELIQGAPLSVRMGQGPMSPAEALPIVSDLLEGLEHAHENGVIHRDLKPDNIMISGDTAKILDFGLAKAVQTLELGNDLKTQTGLVMGTPRYMSPEQAVGDPVDHRGDLYAVAVILHEMLMGKPLFTGEQVVQILQRQVSTPPEPLDLKPHPEINVRKLAKVVDKALSKNADERYQTARALRRALQSCRGATDDDIDWRAVPSSRKRIAGAAVALAVLVGGAVWLARPSAEDRALQAIEGGRLGEAEALTAELFEQRPTDPKVALLIGHLAAARQNESDSVERYIEAMAGDPSLSEDPRLQDTVKQQMKLRTANAEKLIETFSAEATPAAAPTLQEIAMQAGMRRFRRTAYEGLERLGKADSIDRFTYLTRELDENQTNDCNLRRWYVERIAELDHPGVLAILQREQRRTYRPDFFSSERSTSACMKTLIGEAIRKRTEHNTTKPSLPAPSAPTRKSRKKASKPSTPSSGHISITPAN
jgi:tRNA A-37 threonylcarbamoyl transferase component Bud32